MCMCVFNVNYTNYINLIKEIHNVSRYKKLLISRDNHIKKKSNFIFSSLFHQNVSYFFLVICSFLGLYIYIPIGLYFLLYFVFSLKVS